MSYKFDPENPFKSEHKQAETAIKASEAMGLKIEQFFSTPGVHPFDQLEWERRSAKITGDNGQACMLEPVSNESCCQQILLWRR
jgi:hypothetical protein